MQKVLITGGAGFIGSHLAELLAAEHSVRILDNFSTGSYEHLRSLRGNRRVEVVEGSVSDARDAEQACREIDVVYHLAVSCLRRSLNHPLESHEVNAGGTLRLCQAALHAHVKKFVYVSSSEVYGSAITAPMSEAHPTEPTTVYGAAKLAGEHYVKAHHRTYGMPVVIVRPFNTYGPREPWKGTRAEVIPRFTLCMLNGRSPVIFGDGNQTRDFTFVEDTALGIAMAAQCDALVGRAVNIAAGKERSITQMAEMLREELGSSVQPCFAAPRPGDVLRHVADVTLAAKSTGFEAKTDLREGLRRTIAWLRLYANQESAVRMAASANW